MKWKSTRTAAVAVFAAATLTLSACGSSDSDTGADGGSGETVKIGFMGDLTGPNKALGINIINGAKLALQEYEATNPDVSIELVEYDSQGDPKQASALAPKVIDDGVVGLVGPAFSGETADTGPAWEEAGLPFISPSATRVSLADNGWTTFHRLLADDGFQGPGVADVLANSSFTKIAVIDDASEYGKGLADEVAAGAAELDIEVAVQESVAAEGTTVPNYSSVVAALQSADVDAIFYGGYYAQSGGLVKQLRDGGIDAVFVSGDGSLDPAFITGAGAAAEGAVLTCACALFTADSPGAAGEFYTNYTEAFDTDPGTYSPEGYDAMQSFIKAVQDGNSDRASILSYVTDIDFEGVSKPVKFEDNGNIIGGTIFVYQVEDGKIVQIGTTEDASLS